MSSCSEVKLDFNSAETDLAVRLYGKSHFCAHHKVFNLAAQ